MQFACLVNETNFEVEENILAISCLLRLQNDIRYLLKTNFKEELGYGELNKLKKHEQRIYDLANRTNLKQIIPRFTEYSYVSINSKKFSRLIEKVEERERSGLIQNHAYIDLIEWVKEYRNLNPQDFGKKNLYYNFPWEHEEAIDTMYELWIIFEMLSYFENKKNVKVLQQIKNKKGEFGGFNLKYGEHDFELLYQKKLSGDYELGADPDFIIKIKDKFPIVMDPKNWTGDFGEARYKMLGYIQNLASYGTKTGILFFSKCPGVVSITGKSYRIIANPSSTQIIFYENMAQPNSKEEMEKHFEIIFEYIEKEL